MKTDLASFRILIEGNSIGRIGDILENITRTTTGENDAVGRTTVVANSLRITRVADADFVSSTGQTRSLVELARCITNNSGIER